MAAVLDKCPPRGCAQLEFVQLELAKRPLVGMATAVVRTTPMH
jgi:hypothetical protein